MKGILVKNVTVTELVMKGILVRNVTVTDQLKRLKGTQATPTYCPIDFVFF